MTYRATTFAFLLGALLAFGCQRVHVGEDDAEDAGGEAEENSPQLDEALQILVDLVSHKRIALH